MLDQMIEQQVIEPLIVVTPTFYVEDDCKIVAASASVKIFDGKLCKLIRLDSRPEPSAAASGADPKQSGKISIMGKDGQLHEVTINSPQDAVKYGIGYLSEDRRRYGVVVQKSVTENTTLATMEEYCNGLFINKSGSHCHG